MHDLYDDGAAYGPDDALTAAQATSADDSGIYDDGAVYGPQGQR